MSIGSQIAGYIAGTELDDIPQNVRKTAKCCFMDWLGVTLAGASRLMGLSRHTTVNAMGIAATSGGGLRTVFGTMSKPFHAGKAAMDGLMAYFLARSGMNSAEDIFEGKHGFFDLFTDSPDPAVILDRLGGEFLLPQISFKTYPAPL